MLKRAVRNLAVTGVTIASVTVLAAVGATGASASTATASAPSHATAPSPAEAASGCVNDTFTIADENTYEQCVRDAQVLFNDLDSVWVTHHVNYGVVHSLTVDGFYGFDTAGVVEEFQEFWGIVPTAQLDPATWLFLCVMDRTTGFTGAYWHDAGCATE
jgi:hypothetical protein